jgi:predicted O-methyltransferase YrrM
MQPGKGMLGEIVARAKADPALGEIRRKFAESGIQSWVREDEQSLLFGLGAFAPGEGRIVEVGSFQGGSACFLAAGLARRGRGRLTCIDPFLGAPPWLGTAPHQRTLEIFRRGTRSCGLESWIDVRVGDSPSVSSVWPGEPLDAAFIDGDHSFQGALRDFECWAPKLTPGGLMLIDDIDDPGVPEVKELAELIQGLGSFEVLDSIGDFGIAVFRRTEMPAWEMMEELSACCAERGVYRPWDLTPLHRTGLPPEFLRSKEWKDNSLDEPYQLGFLARCGPGHYGYTPATRPSDRALLRALSNDRNDGNVIELGGFGDRIRTILRQPGPLFRVIFCAPDEVRRLSSSLLPGGLILARIPKTDDASALLAAVACFEDTGFKGSVLQNSILFGIYQPHLLNAETTVDLAMRAAGVSAEPGPRLRDAS